MGGLSKMGRALKMLFFNIITNFFNIVKCRAYDIVPIGALRGHHFRENWVVYGGRWIEQKFSIWGKGSGIRGLTASAPRPLPIIGYF